MNRFKEIKACRICGNQDFLPIIDLGSQVLSGIFPDKDDVVVPSTPLDVLKCDDSSSPEACGLVQLRHSADVEEMYGTTYGYYSSLSASMVTHLNTILEKLSNFQTLERGDYVLDIGCNDGTLLGLISTPGVHRVGIDPSSKKFLEKFDDDISVICDFFSHDLVQKKVPDASFSQITAIAMFYDLDEPGAFLRGVSELLAEDGIWALELAYLPSMLSNLVYDQICHEHVTYPSFRQIERLANDADLRVLDVSLNDVNGGSFLIVGCRSDNSSYIENSSVESIRIGEKALKERSELNIFAERVEEHKRDVRQFLLTAAENGQTVMGYGASTKGNIVLNHCEVGRDLISAVCDANPEKWGRVTPGSKIPIISKEEMRARKPDILFVLIWHFYEEVLKDEERFIREGGKIVFDLPRIHTVDKSNYEDHLRRGFSRFSFAQL